jgi:hypothetical protein
MAGGAHKIVNVVPWMGKILRRAEQCLAVLHEAYTDVPGDSQH